MNMRRSKERSNKVKSVEKEFRRLSVELNNVRNEIRNLGYTKLDTPIRHGFYYEMKLDYKLSSDIKYKELYEVLTNKDLYHWGKDKSTSLQMYLDKNNIINISNHFLLLNPKEFKRLSDKSQSLCVIHKWKTSDYSGRQITNEAYRVKIPSNYITFKYSKAYITHRRLINPELESRRDNLDMTLSTNPKFIKLWNIGSSDWDDMKDDFRYDRKITKAKLKVLFK